MWQRSFNFPCTKGSYWRWGYIPGEVKVAITLRLLAGGCHFDLAVIFDVSPNHCKVIFTQVLRDWIIKPNLGKINMEAYLRDITTMKVVSNGFARRSNGLLQGAIGAIDGWLVRIQRPSSSRDGVTHSTSFYSRKGFFALNVQCIVDDQKRILWASYSNNGSSHDSSAFRSTKLYNRTLKELKDTLFQHSLFIIGDSVYAIESYLILSI